MEYTGYAYFEDQEYELDVGVVAGIVISVLLIVAGVVASGKGVNYVSPGSLLIVLGGTVGATLVQFGVYDLKQSLTAFRNVLFNRVYLPEHRIHYLVDLAHAVRKDGILVLEQAAADAEDRFLRLALEIAVDGQGAENVKRILENEMRSTADRHRRAINVFQTMGSYAPAMGLIGTLMGLIQLLGSLDNPATVGPAMSVALVTTLYGAILANLVFLPIAGKLRNRSDEETMIKQITTEGMIGISKAESPIIVEQRLQSFMPVGRSF